MFVMAVTTVIVISILDTQTLQFSSLRNTLAYDRSRYLAEAGVQHALAILESNYDNPALYTLGIANTAFPVGSTDSYSATVRQGPNGTVIIAGTGNSGAFTRRLEIVVKMGG